MRPSRKRKKLNTKYIDECTKLAKKRTDAYLVKRWIEQVTTPNLQGIGEGLEIN